MKNGKFFIKSTKRGQKMLKIEEFDIKVAMKEEYLQGRITAVDYSNWLSSQGILTIKPKNAQIDPNLAFRKKKGTEIVQKRLATTCAEIGAVVARKMTEGKYAWMDHAEEPDEDIPF